MTSPWGIKMLNTGIGLDFIEFSLYEGSRNHAARQMITVLKLRLKPLDAYEFLRAKDKKKLLSVIERVKRYKTSEEVNSLLDIVNERFSVIEEDWLKSLSSQVQEKLLDASGLVGNRSILDCLTSYKSCSTENLWPNSIYARAIIELKINPQQYDFQEIETTIMNTFSIPTAFHEDLTLRGYICPITHKPIRYPVEDPTSQKKQSNPILYEKSAIINILKSSPISPITQEPLTVAQLIPRQDIQDVIEMKLYGYSVKIGDYLETNPYLL